MREQRIKADRLAAFSEGVIAVIITIMVLEFRAPDGAFIATIWLNHYHPLPFAPRVGFALICTALLSYLTPQAPTPGIWSLGKAPPPAARSSFDERDEDE
jgi:hypothetical protein